MVIITLSYYVYSDLKKINNDSVIYQINGDFYSDIIGRFIFTFPVCIVS